MPVAPGKKKNKKKQKKNDLEKSRDDTAARSCEHRCRNRGA